jgi:diguanylate cyclase (GGDEF)-like protein
MRVKPEPAFKKVNDTRGHAAGDHLLQSGGDRLRGCARPMGIAARLGGDECAALIGDSHTAQDAGSLAERRVAELEVPLAVPEGEALNRASVGVAIFEGDDDEDR